MIRLSVIIVNYNVKYFLEQAVRSTLLACRNIRAEVIIVDNHSEDGSVEHIRKIFVEGGTSTPIHLIANPDNTGFSRANNQGIAMATGEYILLLNPDTVVAEDTFEKCLAYMDAHPEAGGMGVRMLDGTGRFLPESKRAFPSPEVAFYKAFGLANAFPRSRVFGKYHLGYLDEHQNHTVDVLAGAFMLMRRSVIDTIGALDESFFMYGEDIDLSYRIVQAGYTNIYFAEAPIIHYKGESTKKASFNYVRMFYHAMKIFARKHFSGTRAGLFIFILNAAIYLRAGIAALVRMLGRMAQPVFEAVLFFGGLFLVKAYWEYYVKYIDGGTYPDSYLYINVPLYIVTWLFLVFLNGGYDRNATPARLIRGMALGTLAIAALYGFLPEHLRYSRGMIIAGAAVNTVLLLGVRGVLHFFRQGNFNFGEAPVKRILIAGGTAECLRTHQLLHQLQLGNQVIGYVRTDNRAPEHALELGNVQEIDRLIGLYEANELIFCAADITHAHILQVMEKLAGSTDFKIVQPGSEAIIGSNSRDTAGDIYTLDVHFSINQPQYQRMKRTMDLLIALGCLVTAPLSIWLVRNKGGYLRNSIKVLLGRRSWVGYMPHPSTGGKTGLPRIKPGILHPLAETDATALPSNIAERVNYMYARDYRPADDLRLIRKHYRLLGNS